MTNFPYGRVTVAATAAQLVATTAVRSVAIFAEAANAGVTYVGGDSSVTTSTGFPLNAGDTITLDTVDASGVWIIGTASDHVRYIGTVNP